MTRQDAALGHDRAGSGPLAVIVLNDWLCDCSTWDAARPYIDLTHFSWVFADLRGYGRSRALTGDSTVLESATDVLALADRLDWHRFAIVGHSMSTLVALHLMQHHAQRVTRAVLLTPAPPASFRANDAALEGARALALGDDQMRLTSLTQRFGHRYSMGWTALKAERWRATADPDAAARYAAMFMQGGVPEPTARVTGPVLAVTGAHDAPWMRRDAVERDLSPICDQLQIDTIADSGHYPMQETPPLTVSLTERFLLADGEPTTARGDGSL